MEDQSGGQGQGSHGGNDSGGEAAWELRERGASRKEGEAGQAAEEVLGDEESGEDGLGGLARGIGAGEVPVAGREDGRDGQPGDAEGAAQPEGHSQQPEGPEHARER